MAIRGRAIKGWKKVTPTTWVSNSGYTLWITQYYPSQFWYGSGYKGWFVLMSGRLLAPKTPDTPRAWDKELTRAEAMKIAMKHMRDHPEDSKRKK